MTPFANNIFMKTLLNLFVGLIVIFWTSKLQAQPVITKQPTNQIVLVGNSASLGVSVSGTGPFTYQWQFNGTNLPPNYIITTVAGNGTNGFSGDGGTATNAELNIPPGVAMSGVAVDTTGNLFIADPGNNRIREVNTNGIITTVAGNGNYGYSGDGGNPTNAELSEPQGMAGVYQGDIYIADWGNHCIRAFAPGFITTVVGTGTNGYSGDGGYAVYARLEFPNAVAVDTNGNLFIADSPTFRIRKVNATNSIITTVAGNGTNGYSGDGGAATNAKLSYAACVAVDRIGRLFIADSENFRIRMVNTNGTITTVAGNGTNGYSGDGGAATNAEFSAPPSVAVDRIGNLFIADQINNCIRMVNTNGIITTFAGHAGSYGSSGDGGAATNARLNSPVGLAVDAIGNLLIVDSGNNRIRKVANLTSQPTLVFNTFSNINIGNYSVVITSSSGSVTSSVANITIPGYNKIFGQSLAGGKMKMPFLGLAGVNYALDRSSSLSPANWIPQVTNPADANGNLIFTNSPNAATNNFWRIRSVP